MKLAPFLLEQWSEAHRDSVRYSLAASTGPKWTLQELRALMSDAERGAFDEAVLNYCPGRGRDSLRAAIAGMYGADPEEVLTFTGGAEALLASFVLAAEPGGNVLVPQPAFPPLVHVPEALGLEVRRYRLAQQSGGNAGCGTRTLPPGSAARKNDVSSASAPPVNVSTSSGSAP